MHTDIAWGIVGWIGAISVALIIVALTVRIVVNLASPRRNNNSTRILKG